MQTADAHKAEDFCHSGVPRDPHKAEGFCRIRGTDLPPIGIGSRRAGFLEVAAPDEANVDWRYYV